MRDHTIDEALVELARTMKALKALRAARKQRTPVAVLRSVARTSCGQARQPGPDAQTGRLEGGAMSTWLPRDRKSTRPPVADWIDVRYYDGKEFYRKWAPDCYWGEDSLISFWRRAA